MRISDMHKPDFRFWALAFIPALIVLLLGPLALNAQEPLTSPKGEFLSIQNASNGPYRLQPGDVIQVRFYLNPEMNDEIQIQPDGHVSLQVIGDVAVAGKTVSEASDMLQEKYSHELKNVKVIVQVRSYGGQKVFVAGEVNRPGVVSLVGGMSVIGAIGEAGGVRVSGTHKSVVLIRKGPDGKPLQQKLSLIVHGKASPDAVAQLQPYDVIIVPARAITKADRWVDEYIRQISPANMAVGFEYLYNHAVSTTSVLPF